MIRVYGKPVSYDPGMTGGFMIDIRPRGVYADIHNGPKNLGAPFGAVSYTSPDWDFVSPEEKKRRKELLDLLSTRIKETAR